MRPPSPPGRSAEMIRIKGDAVAWSTALSSVFVELEVQHLDMAHPPLARMYRYPFGDMTFVRALTRGGAHRVVRSTRLIRSSTHNNFFIGYMLSGEATLSQGSGRALLQARDLAIIDSSREYAIEVPRAFDSLWIKVPRHRLEGRLHSLAEIMAQRIDGHTGIGHFASNMLLAALAEAPKLRVEEANRIANHLLDLIGLALVGPGRRVATEAPSNYRLSALRRVQTFIDERLDDETLSVREIARAHHVSVRYLNKLFEREGTSIARWTKMRRLERCRMDLESNSAAGRTIGEIAYSHGFRNISHFNRAFKARFGCSPRSLRDAR
jgi:AraC family transcriptional regulator, positive regulator of tynA and feaB